MPESKPAARGSVCVPPSLRSVSHRTHSSGLSFCPAGQAMTDAGPAPTEVSILPFLLRSTQPERSPAIFSAEALFAVPVQSLRQRLATTTSPVRLTVVRDGSEPPPG